MTLTLTQPKIVKSGGPEPKPWPTVDTPRLAVIRWFGASSAYPGLSARQRESIQGYQPFMTLGGHQENYYIAGPIVSLPRKGRVVSPSA